MNCRGTPPISNSTFGTFNDKIKEKDTVWFVKFCVPWCKHCENLGSLWDDLGKTMEGRDEIEVGEVDCGMEKSVCSKVDIYSYPTFKVFYDGEEVARYQGNSKFFITCKMRLYGFCSINSPVFFNLIHVPKFRLLILLTINDQL